MKPYCSVLKNKGFFHCIYIEKDIYNGSNIYKHCDQDSRSSYCDVFNRRYVSLYYINYPRLFAETELRFIMRQTYDPLVRLGVIFQPLRGVIFGIAFFILRHSFFTESNGWLLMWIVLVSLSVLSTFGPSPASIEGILFTKLPLRIHLIGLPELLLQSFLLSFVVYHWVNNPEEYWISRMMWSLFAIALAASIIGFFKDRNRQ
jgi:hypothetical protein